MALVLLFDGISKPWREARSAYVVHLRLHPRVDGPGNEMRRVRDIRKSGLDYPTLAWCGNPTHKMQRSDVTLAELVTISTCEPGDCSSPKDLG